MSILLGLSPFIVFFVLLRLVSPLAGLAGATLVSAGLLARERRRGGTVKILEIGSLALFAALTLYTLVFAASWTVATVRLAVDGGLLAIVLASLAIGKPFTLQYARERVPEAVWGLPIFFAVNRAITIAWALCFAVLTAADAAAEYRPSIPLWVDIAAAVAAFAAAFLFTLWYPARQRRVFLARQTSGTKA
jgi:hypothetical protein